MLQLRLYGIRMALKQNLKVCPERPTGLKFDVHFCSVAKLAASSNK
jgi:hypothetical protein